MHFTKREIANHSIYDIIISENSMKYKKRIADTQLDLKLESFGATLIVGPKGCGKTICNRRYRRLESCYPFKNCNSID